MQALTYADVRYQQHDQDTDRSVGEENIKTYSQTEKLRARVDKRWKVRINKRPRIRGREAILSTIISNEYCLNSHNPCLIGLKELRQQDTGFHLQQRAPGNVGSGGARCTTCTTV